MEYSSMAPFILLSFFILEFQVFSFSIFLQCLISQPILGTFMHLIFYDYHKLIVAHISGVTENFFPYLIDESMHQRV